MHDLAAGTFLALLDQHERQALEELGVARAFPRGSILMFQGEPGERVMILRAGRVKIATVEADGREVMLSIRDPGDILGELAFIDGHPRLATVTALEPVKALVIPSVAFRVHLERTPRVAVTLLEVITRRFRETTVKREQFATSDTVGRLSARIVELAERYGEPSANGVNVLVPLSHEELGAWTGASRAGVAQAFRALRELGWIETHRRRIVICDLTALRARAA
jgi:CRP/FNR family cyclic AMP-dependent transcriptional regulator